MYLANENPFNYIWIIMYLICITKEILLHIKYDWLFFIELSISYSKATWRNRDLCDLANTSHIQHLWYIHSPTEEWQYVLLCVPCSLYIQSKHGPHALWRWESTLRWFWDEEGLIEFALTEAGTGGVKYGSDNITEHRDTWSPANSRN